MITRQAVRISESESGGSASAPRPHSMTLAEIWKRRESGSRGEMSSSDAGAFERSRSAECLIPRAQICGSCRVWNIFDRRRACFSWMHGRATTDGATAGFRENMAACPWSRRVADPNELSIARRAFNGGVSNSFVAGGLGCVCGSSGCFGTLSRGAKRSLLR